MQYSIFSHDGRENRGPTPLIYAAMWGNLEAVKFLIEYGSPVGAVQEWEISVAGTALMWAVWSGQCEMVRLLVDEGADPGEIKEVAVRLAVRRGEREMVNIMGRNWEEVTREGGEGLLKEVERIAKQMMKGERVVGKGVKVEWDYKGDWGIQEEERKYNKVGRRVKLWDGLRWWVGKSGWNGGYKLL